MDIRAFFPLCNFCALIKNIIYLLRSKHFFSEIYPLTAITGLPRKGANFEDLSAKNGATLKAGIRKLESGIRNPESGIRKPETGIENDDRKIQLCWTFFRRNGTNH